MGFPNILTKQMVNKALCRHITKMVKPQLKRHPGSKWAFGVV